MWSVKQTRRFARQYKKLHDNGASDVDAAVDEGIRLVYLEAVGPHENFYRDLKR